MTNFINISGVRNLILTWLLCLVAISSARASTQRGGALTEITKAYIYYCNNEHEKADALLNAHLKARPNDPTAFFLLNKFLPYREELLIDKTLDRIRQKEEPKTDLDRLVFADAHFATQEQDLSIIKKLLDFRSSDPLLEAWRVLYLASIDALENKEDEAFRKSETAYAVLGIDAPEALINLLSLQVQNPELKKRQKSYQSEIRRFSNSDPYRFVIESHIHWLSNSTTEANESLKKAFRKCSSDQYIATLYLGHIVDEAVGLMNVDDRKSFDLFKEAETLADSILSSRKYHYPIVDIYAGYLALETKDDSVVKRHLTSARKAGIYLTPQEREWLEGVEVILQKEIWKKRVGISGLVLLVLLFPILLFWLSTRSKRRPQDDTVENIAELAAAEKAAQTESDLHRISIARFDSGQGFTHNSVLELVLYLAKHDIAADYTSSNTLGEAVEIFSLRVPSAQAAEAKALLDKKLKS